MRNLTYRSENYNYNIRLTIEFSSLDARRNELMAARDLLTRALKEVDECIEIGRMPKPETEV